MDAFWAGKETFQSLNVGGPFTSYVSFLNAQAEKLVCAIERHEALSTMREAIPLIEAFVAAMEKHRAELNNTCLVLTHRDLHFGNIMYDVTTRLVTAVLDWKFACVVLAPRWDPVRAFLWNGIDNDEKVGLWERVATKCRAKGTRFFENLEYQGKRQEHMQLAINRLRAIVEVMPKGQVDRPVEIWKEEMIRHMDAVCAY